MTATTPSPLMARQLSIEADMIGLGRDRYLRHIQDAKARGQESATDYGVQLLRSVVGPLADRIEAYKAEGKKDAGRAHVARPYLEVIDAPVAAFITARVVLDAVSGDPLPVQTVAYKIGCMLEDEGRIGKLAKEQEPLYRVLKRDLKKVFNKSQKSKRKIFRKYQTEAGVEWVDWPQTDKVHLGVKLMDFLRETSGVIFTELDGGPVKKRRTRVYPTPELLEWIQGRVSGSETLCPTWLPTVVPPKPWTSPFSWPYYSPDVRRRGLVKGARKGYLDELAIADLRVVYRSINALQETAWKVNGAVLRVLETAWEKGIEVGGLPSPEVRALLPRHSKAEWEAKSLEDRIAYKYKAKMVRLAIRQDRQDRLRFFRILGVARRFRDDPRIYFPHQLDFRGRAYALPVHLQPQGEDMSKALLTFAEGHPIVDDDAVKWLAIHGANSYGYDKASLAARVQWAADHTEEVLQVAADPLGNRWWESADKPWQFLAWCFEWAGFAKEGMGFVSYLPVSVDGSCNGIQIFSAMLRDEVGGAAVNLIPYDEPQDIYQRVADGVVERLKVDPSPLAAQWLAFGVDRGVTKRCVMTLPYGSTRFAARQFIVDAIAKKIANGSHEVFRKADKAAQFLVNHVWEAISDTVIGARMAMAYLQEIAAAVAGEGIPLHWTAPSGFICFQSYRKSTIKRIRTDFAGTSLLLGMREETSEVDRRRHCNGVSPNLVHSLDAAVLAFTVDASLDAGIKAFAMVHDSFGTHAAKVSALSVCLRHAFVGTFASNVLADFTKQVHAAAPHLPLPPMPAMGTLNLESVLEAEYFFA